MRLVTLKLLLRRRYLASSAPPQLEHMMSKYYYYNNYSGGSLSQQHGGLSSVDHNNNNGGCHVIISTPPPHQYHHHHHLIVGFNRRGRRQFSSQPNYFEQQQEMFVIPPVTTLISLLDSYHNLTALPWWFIISSSTLALRLAIFPLIVLQIKKINTIAHILPTLPPSFPPPLSGRNFTDQFALFCNKKKAAGCPSVFWFCSSFVVQVPCFFLWLMSIRRMSVDHHPGFDCGGALWFQNLTEYPHGALGPIFPLLIAGLHFTNIQMSFKNTSLQQLPGTLGLLTKLYRIYLQLLTLPILFASFNVPQGSLVYWLTNSSLSLLQLICLSHPGVLEYMGLPKKGASVLAPTNKEGHARVADIFILTKQGEVPAQSLAPVELVSYSIKILTDGRTDAAMRLLRLAIEKDPGYARALLIMGQTLLQNKQFAEATECLESAISKLLVAGYPTEGEEVDLLILSSQWAGIANAQQGKMEESLLHLERIAQLEEPEDSKSKAHYYDGLFILSSALLHVGRKAEAFKYLQKAAAHNPAYNAHFEHLETHLKDFAGDLASTRRDF